MASRRLEPVIAAAIAVGAAGVTLLGVRSPEPAPIVLGPETCTRCHKPLEDPHFAGRIYLDDGTVLSFDDPGCLLSYLLDPVHPGTDRAWFRHVHEDRWVRAADARFIRTAYSPMGYELGAVDARSADAMTLEAAKELVRQRGHP